MLNIIKKSPIDRFNRFCTENQEWFLKLSEMRTTQDPASPLKFGGVVAVKEAVQDMRLWVEANPRKGNKKNWEQFVLNWLKNNKPNSGLVTPLTAKDEYAHYRSKVRVGVKNDGFSRIGGDE